MLAHLAVADRDARLGHELLERARDAVDRLDPVVDVVDLAAAVELVDDRALHHGVRGRNDDGLDRHAVLGRGLDERQVAHAHERHLQRARDRRRRERQDVDGGLELLEALLVHHAEALLLVDDDQAEVAEDDVLLQDPVRSDDDVDLAARQVVDDRLRFFLALEA